jgi:hypothetical protein
MSTFITFIEHTSTPQSRAQPRCQTSHRLPRRVRRCLRVHPRSRRERILIRDRLGRPCRSDSDCAWGRGRRRPDCGRGRGRLLRRRRRRRRRRRASRELPGALARAVRSGLRGPRPPPHQPVRRELPDEPAEVRGARPGVMLLQAEVVVRLVSGLGDAAVRKSVGCRMRI